MGRERFIHDDVKASPDCSHGQTAMPFGFRTDNRDIALLLRQGLFHILNIRNALFVCIRLVARMSPLGSVGIISNRHQFKSRMGGDRIRKIGVLHNTQDDHPVGFFPRFSHPQYLSTAVQLSACPLLKHSNFAVQPHPQQIPQSWH